MELENVSAEIRPRSDWEAIDLGISLVREHFGAVARAWLATVVPLCLVILLVSAPFSLVWGVFLLWWLKPLFERVVLYYLSRALFGEKPRTGVIFRAFPQMMLTELGLIGVGVFLAVSGYYLWNQEDLEILRGVHFLCVVLSFFYRSVAKRALSLPVRMLENLGGKSARARLQVLSRRGTAAVALMVLCLVMELGLFVSLFYFAMFFVPTETMVDWNWHLENIFEVGMTSLPVGMGWFLALLYIVALSLSAWFYIGGGFALYINARTWIEGWDVELEFKRIGKRFSAKLSVILLCALSFFAIQPAQAQESLDDILASEDFKVEKKQVKVWVPDEMSGEIPDVSGVGLLMQAFGKILFWALVTLAVIGLATLIYRHRHLLARGESQTKREKKRPPKTLRGMNITPESLPNDLLAASRQAWHAGDFHLALSLLYRGAISDLLTKNLVELTDSATEADCLRQVRSSAQQVAEYFEKLTAAWVNLAYGKRRPALEIVELLWRDWPFENGEKEQKGETVA